jgi:hypothetical protein
MKMEELVAITISTWCEGWAQMPDPVDHRRGEPGMSVVPVARKLKSDDILAALAELFVTRGLSAHIRPDNEPEFIATAVQE